MQNDTDTIMQNNTDTIIQLVRENERYRRAFLDIIVLIKSNKEVSIPKSPNGDVSWAISEIIKLKKELNSYKQLPCYQAKTQ